MNNLTLLLAKKAGVGAGPLLMTHCIAGYPTLPLSLEVARAMVRSGSSILEIQIPFSDPIADGPTIVEASHVALQQNVRIADVFDLVRTLSSESTTPIVLMSYANPVFRYGIERFVADAAAAAAGVSGVILPDVPIDSPEGREFVASAKAHDVHPILVVSPGVPEERLAVIGKNASGFVYSTSRQGTTGANSLFSSDLANFLTQLRRNISVPVAVGFGVKSHDDIVALAPHADIVVVGSLFVSRIQNATGNDIPKVIEDAVQALIHGA